MKRLHVHVSVDNHAESIRFYSGMFAAQPTIVKSDYAKWQLDDPRINFAISQRGAEVGLNHLASRANRRKSLRKCSRVWPSCNRISKRKKASPAATPNQTNIGPMIRPAFLGRPSSRSIPFRCSGSPTKKRQKRPAAFHRSSPRPNRKPHAARRPDHKIKVLPAAERHDDMADKSYNILFLCTGNSARSIMAEALVTTLSKCRFIGFSAGSKPGGKVTPIAVEQVMKTGYPVEKLRSTSWDEFATAGAPHMDFIITDCAKAAGAT